MRPGEGVTALLLMFDLFLLLTAYYLLKTIREPLILTVPHGAEVKSYAAAATAALLVILVPVYSAVASRLSRVALINGVTAFFIACLLAFFVLNLAGAPIGVPFFIWVGIFNMMIIAQLWALANDVYTVDQGQRLFAIVGFGASMGSIAGSFATGHLLEFVGPGTFMLAGAALLGVSLLLTNVISLRASPPPPEARSPRERRRHRATDPSTGAMRGRSGFSLVLSDRYLLLIALLMLTVNLVNTNGEYILGRRVVSLYESAHAGMGGSIDEQKVIGEFYGDYFTAVNVVAALLQVLVVPRAMKRLGVRWSLLVLPLVALTGYTTMAFVPLLALIRWVKISENSLDYSLQNTVRHALYLPTRREAKYKAKQANDTFFVRFGDVLSAGIVFAGTAWLGLAVWQFALLNALLVALWLALAAVLGARFQRLARRTGME